VTSLSSGLAYKILSEAGSLLKNKKLPNEDYLQWQPSGLLIDLNKIRR
jgi:hypothetical protein